MTRHGGRPRRARVLFAALAALGLAAPLAAEPTTTIVVRGKPQTLRRYGPTSGPLVLVASGDGGWIHLGVAAADILAAEGFSVAGFDSRAYLSGFTTRQGTLTPADVPGDFRVLLEALRGGRPERVLLVGVSEGAGLAVLAGSSPEVQPMLSGIVALGLPEQNELGWRFRDSMIYITKKVPDEPLFRSSDYIGKLGTVPLAGIWSTHDEFVPLAEAKRLMDIPGPPRRMWVIDAADHRFSDRLEELAVRLREAVAWMRDARGAGKPESVEAR